MMQLWIVFLLLLAIGGDCFYLAAALLSCR
ncbi:Uncharacterised protein [Budvicia aquatica]|uniref:Uncharacterized protein n=1 Tax=Budvicia aquatica TaxID=82979 RepID=A0A484ZW39_9GAMM|nr:Uncharacterised protein [Budvicia aquatica]